MSKNARRQAIFWLLTIPADSWNPPTELPDWLHWLKGQKERGSETGYEHFQVLVAFAQKASLRQVKQRFGDKCHAEVSRSEAASRYVWKDDTAIPDTRFEYGSKPIRRNSKTDWDSVWTSAKSGLLESVPSNIRICHYRQLQSIAADYEDVPAMERSCMVFWGVTGTGKSRNAWNTAPHAYSKCPRSKFWCGYSGQQDVIIDEFRGGIDIAHLLRWLDRYPVRVEIKGGSRPLRASRFIITSNLHPRDWYKDLDEETYKALERRLSITHYTINQF